MRRLQTPLILSFLAAPLFAQAPLIEKIDVSVVNVDVTVTDRAGNPVRGLTREDFEIFEDGRLQPITNFYAVERAVSNAAATAENERFRRKVLVIIDNFSTTRHERNQALARLEEFVNDRFRGGEYDWSIAVLDTRVRMLLPPTSDKQAIHAALKEIRRGGSSRLQLASDSEIAVVPVERDAAAAACNTITKAQAQTSDCFAKDADFREQILASAAPVQALIEATRAFATTSGKKIIMLLTGQLLPSDWGSNDLAKNKEIALLRNAVIEEANASSVNFYIINPEGIDAGDPSMYWIARETGGQLMPGNDVEASLRQFDTGSSNFYSLGYRPQHPEDGRYHRIEVRVKKGPYRLQYRDGYSSVPTDVQLERALHSTFATAMMPSTTIPVALAFGEPVKTKGGLLVHMKTIVAADRLQFIPAGEGSIGRVDIYVSIFDAAGRIIAFSRFARHASLRRGDAPIGTFEESTPVRLAKGRQYRVVVAVRDPLTDALGIAQQSVKF